MSEKSVALAVPVDVTMRRPPLFGIPAMPILATPLVVRRAQAEEAGALAALLGRAFDVQDFARYVLPARPPEVKVSVSVLYMSMSLDGYIAGPNDDPDNPGGDGFMRLHDWYGFEGS